MDIATLLRHAAPSSEDRARVLCSLDRVTGKGALAFAFFESLEQASPKWMSALPASWPERRACFAQCICWVTGHLTDTTVLGSMIYRIGASPAGATSRRLNLGFLASALLDSLSQNDPEWDEDTRMAWLRTCAWVSWCVRAGHEARLAGRVASSDTLRISKLTTLPPTSVRSYMLVAQAAGPLVAQAAGTPTLVSAA